jgi:hypothetical protein
MLGIQWVWETDASMIKFYVHNVVTRYVYVYVINDKKTARAL